MGDAGKVDLPRTQPVKGNGSQLVEPDPGNKSNSRSQCRQIVRGDGRRASEGNLQAACQNFLLQCQLAGQSVQDQVEVNLAGDGDVEIGQSGPRRSRRVSRLGSDCEANPD